MSSSLANVFGPKNQAEETPPPPARSRAPAPAGLSYVANFYNRYPGEVVDLFAQVVAHRPLSGATLKISLPAGLTLEQAESVSAHEAVAAYSEVTEEGHDLVWILPETLAAGERYEQRLEARVSATPRDRLLTSRARLLSSYQTTLTQVDLSLEVSTRGRYLEYLPAFYESDEVLGQLLMMCESFWNPLETQIGGMHYYLDPGLTPANLLPWLASWLDLEFDDDWSEAQRRALLRWGPALHRRRGTKWGLKKYLEIYTGQEANIIEHRFKDFVLDEEAKLDFGIALGPGNAPHTFTVTLALPAFEVDDEEERLRLEKIRRRRLESIIESQKPAHTVYILNLE